jgi:hypothetical protein
MKFHLEATTENMKKGKSACELKKNQKKKIQEKKLNRFV